MLPLSLVAQTLLSKNVSINVTNQRLDQVLEILSNKGDFYFSYNSRMVNRDSLVSLTAINTAVGTILSRLFDPSFEFRESGNYVIIRKAPIRMTMITEKAATTDRIYAVSGFVYDEQSGAPINEASIYEKQLLAATLSNGDGSFRLRLKSSKASTATLTISKEFYEDTSITIEPRFNQRVTVTMMPMEDPRLTRIIAPGDYLQADSLRQRHLPELAVQFTDTNGVEKTTMGRFLLSTKQQVQSLNLRKFFTTRPFQLSLTPGLSTHGKLSSQVINHFSLNVFGGYTAGTHGVELGGLFNIDKKEVHFFQAAGLFNVVGGRMTGFQVAGINNTVLDSAAGFQAAGINNFVRGNFSGFQTGGIYNHVSGNFTGFQAGGIANFALRQAKGVQVAGIANVSATEIRGLQVAGIINYAKRLRGVQIGLINIVDSSDGVSIGLINVVMKGYHQLSFSTNEVLNVNAAFKTGNRKLYSILQAGLQYDNAQKAYGFGYGFGSDVRLNKSGSLLFNPEFVSQYLYLGSWDYLNLLNRAQLHVKLRVNRFLSVYAGPAYNVFVSDQTAGIRGYRFPIPPTGYAVHDFSNRVTGWLGWNAGINLF